MPGPSFPFAVRPASTAFLLAALASAALAGAGPLAAQAVTPTTLKAAFLLNFVRFAEWPTGALKTGDPLVLCIAHDRRLLDALENTVKGQTVAGRSLDARDVASAADAAACQLLYVGGWEDARVRLALEELKGVPVLTVSDRERFADAGGVIQLLVEKDRMRFAINIDAAGIAA